MIRVLLFLLLLASPAAAQVKELRQALARDLLKRSA